MERSTGLCLLPAAELLARDLPPRRDVLPPLLASDTAALVCGPPGIGKSFFALGVAWAVAAGGSFLGWQAPRPRRVIYVDGELGAAELRNRLALFGPPPGRLTVLAHGLGEGRLLDLAEDDGILRLMAAWPDPALVVLDSLSTLAGLGGDPERRQRLQRFLLHQRVRHRAVLIVDDANRTGGPRGGRRAGAADLVLSLRRPEAALRSGNARFEIHVEKTRQRRGPPLMPVLAELETDESGAGRWRWGPVRAGRVERVAALLNRGLGARDAAAAIGVGRTTLYKLRAQARTLGLLDRPGRAS